MSHDVVFPSAEVRSEVRVEMLFHDWGGIWRTVLVGALAYVALVLLLRVSGKRTLSKMNAFDLVVTVSLGSTLATILLSRDVALAEGVTAFLTLVLLQFALSWLSVRSRRVRQWVKSEPELLFHQGEFLRAAMKRERVTEAELYAAIRSQGIADLTGVEAIVLETDGSMTVLQKAGENDRSTLRFVANTDKDPVAGWRASPHAGASA